MLNRPSRRAAASRRRQRGLSLVALMVGATISLFVAGAAILGSSASLNENRRLLLEARLQQDLRAAMTLVTRDLRRAGYWGRSSHEGIWNYGSTGVSPNSFASMEIMPERPATFSSSDPVTQTGSATSSVTYRWDENGNGTLGSDEVYSIDLHEHRLRMRIGSSGSWQEVTDPGTLKVTAFSVTPGITWLPLYKQCPAASPCDPSQSGQNCPVIAVRTLTLSITAEAPTDPAVKRTLQSQVRLRNNQYAGACTT